MNAKFAKIASIQRDNMLMNSDFKSGIINQKSQSSYAYVDKPLLTIDGWISYGVNVGVETNTLKIVNRKPEAHTLKQKLDRAYPNQVYTVAVYVASVTGNVYVNFNSETSLNKKLVAGLNVFQMTPVSTLGEFVFYLETNAEIKINFAKVEPGFNYTGMPLWNKPLELKKCSYRYNEIRGIRAYYCEKNNIKDNKSYYFSIPRTVVMDNVPSVSVRGDTSINSTNGICLRTANAVNKLIFISRYDFEIRPYEVLVRVYVTNNTDVENIDAQLFLGDNFVICLDTYNY